VNDAIVPPQTSGVVTTRVSKNGANNIGVSDDLSIAKIDTIAKSRSQYSARDQNKADVVRRFQQGALFHLIRNVIMGWNYISSIIEGYVPSEERAELITSGTKSKFVELTKTYACAVRNQNDRLEVDLVECGEI